MLTATPEYLELLANALSLENTITIHPSSTGGWYSEPDKGKIYYNRPDLQLLPLNLVRAYILHEIAHILYTKNSDDSKRASIKKHGDKIVHDLDNMLEDIRIEHQLYTNYRDFVLFPLHELGITQIITFLEGIEKGGKYDVSRFSRYQQFLILTTFTKIIDHNIFVSTVKNRINKAQVYGNWDKRVRGKFFKYEGEISAILANAKYFSTTDRIKTLVDKDYLPIIEEFIEDNDKKTPPPLSSHSLSPKDLKISETSRAFELTYKDRRHQAKWNKLSKREARALLAPYINTLAVRLVAILKEQRATRWTGQHKSGKLLNRDVYKVATGEERIFTKRITPNVPKHNVYLGFDRSGSMGEDRIINSYLAGVLVEAVCEKLDFPVDLYTYDTNPYHIDNIEDYGGGGDDNREDRLFQLMARDIVNAGKQNDDNLVFVITDGGTTRSGSFIEGETALHKAGATLFGIGIGDDSVEQMIREVYKNGIYVKDVQELPFAMINFMRTIVHR